MPYGCIMAGDVMKNAPWKRKNKFKNNEKPLHQREIQIPGICKTPKTIIKENR